MQSRDEYIGFVAQKHGIIIQKNDPILIVHACFEQFMHELREEQQQHRQEFLSLLEAEQEKWNQESKKRADRVLTAALEASKQAARELVVDNVRDVETAICTAMTPKIVFLEQQYEKIYYLTIANMTAAGFLTLAALFFFFMP